MRASALAAPYWSVAPCSLHDFEEEAFLEELGVDVKELGSICGAVIEDVPTARRG